MAPTFAQVDPKVPFVAQLQADAGPVVLVNQFTADESDVAALLQAWADDAAWMKRQPGYITAQLHRGIAGSTTFVNIAVWEAARALGEAFSSPTFRARLGHYPESTSISPHLFTKIAVAGICTQ